MKVIITGGRTYSNSKRVSEVLEIIRPSLVIHGGALGADTLAGEWAQKNNIPVKIYEANWGVFGLSAGPRRNRTMLEGNVDATVVAFPGGRGTANCVSTAKGFGMKILGVDYMKEGIYEI